MSALRNLGLILWKNFILRKRHYIITACEIILPLLFTAILVILRGSGSQFEVQYINYSQTYDREDIAWQNDVWWGNVTVMYCPNNSYTDELMAHVKNTIEQVNCEKYNCSYYPTKRSVVNLMKVQNEAQMESMTKQIEYNADLFGGISFVNEFPEDGKLPQNLHYRIRLKSPKKTCGGVGFQQNPIVNNVWDTGQLANPFASPGPQPTTGCLYEQSQFLLCQHLLAMKFIDIARASTNRTENSTSADNGTVFHSRNVSESIQLYSQRFPYPPYNKDNGFKQIMENILPLFIVFSFIFISPSLIKNIVLEKEMGTKELMKLMGLPGWIQWAGWFVSAFIMMAISSVIIVTMLCARIADSPLIANTAPELLFVIFLMYIASAIMFCFFISSLFSKPTVASAVGMVAWILTFSLPYNLLTSGQTYTTLTFSDKLAVALLPNMAMAWSIRIIASFEGRSVGLQWKYLAEPAYKGETMCMYHVMIMFVVDMVVYGFLTWYIDHVRPGQYGVGKPWWFPFTKSYWVKEKPVEVDLENLSPHVDSPDFEKDPTGLTPTIIIKNLTKSYGMKAHDKLAVDDISMNFYEGQITALLGHNGAGKTTTMSMLTGMFSPTKGTALINGYDIRTQIDDARQNLGLCPQQNMLFDTLTVSEHLVFFGRLKNLSGDKLQKEVEILLNKLQLYAKRNTLAKELSGGMKRKLNLGISLIGGSSVVILDEPTSGLDPEARRAIWDVLQEIRPGRCIILTTHFMEEADVLGDRIAIMSQGKIKCCGTPYFLKKRYGAGYHLTASKTDDCDVSQLTSVVQRHLPDAYLSSNVSNELSYTLPVEKTSQFPAMFEEIENNLKNLGVNGVGVSVTTMEEVFLKVGELSEKEYEDLSQNEDKYENRNLVATDNNDNQPIELNTGLRLLLQQLYGLLMKRVHYATRRWMLIVAQVVMPIMMVVIVLYINNAIGDVQPMEPALLMDISQYGKTIAVENYTGDALQQNLASAYRGVFPSDDSTISSENIEDYLIMLGMDDFNSYREDHIVAAEFHGEENENVTSSITAWFNGVYLHTLPLTVNLAHNTLLKQQVNSKDWSIEVENAPLPVDDESAANTNDDLKIIKSIIMGIFIPIGLSFLSSSFVVFPIQERTSKSKHLQLMTGVGGALYWGASFVWDFAIHFLSSSVIVIIFATMDGSKIYSGNDQLGAIFLLLLLYGWSAIPFSYMVSFVCQLPASGFALLSVVNMLAGMILSMMIYLFSNMGSDTLQNAGKVLQWFFRFQPTYSVTIGFMNMPLISKYNSQCDTYKPALEAVCHIPNLPHQIKQCCPDCEPYCLKPMSYFAWDPPALAQETFMLAFDGCLYFLLLFLIERGFMYWIWYITKSRYLRLKGVVTTYNTDTTAQIVDSDVEMEKKRINQLFTTTVPSDDALLVHDLTKQFWGLRAVDNLSFGVKAAECFGLLGINGAGKTTTFRMLTGDEVVTNGNAFLHGISLKDDHGMFLKQISYCPQFDAILDHLTGRETLMLFARLRGIPEAEIKFRVKHFLFIFDLTQHADKITMAYSGGNKRKLSAAIAFLGKPSMVFLDEPTTGVDPVARRKLWDIILAAKNRGTSLILTSHSMEECEVLCSRLAIMVNGQFKCLGGIQYLKSKFGQGFTIVAKMSGYSNADQQANIQQKLQQFMQTKYPECVLKDVHQGLVHYHVTDARTPWRYLFSTMEEAKKTFNLEDYSVSQTSLEQVFLSFARQQRITDAANIMQLRN